MRMRKESRPRCEAVSKNREDQIRILANFIKNINKINSL